MPLSKTDFFGTLLTAIYTDGTDQEQATAKTEYRGLSAPLRDKAAQLRSR